MLFMEGAAEYLLKQRGVKMNIMIYGAKSIAFGTYKALRELYPEYTVDGFLVSSSNGNPSLLAGLPVMEIGVFSRGFTQEQKEEIYILVGTPEDIHGEIIKTIKEYGYRHYICMDSRREAELMEAYFVKLGIFPSLHNLSQGVEIPNIQVFMIKFYKDRPLKDKKEFPEWVYPIQVGTELAGRKTELLSDNEGENISGKNGNYCEMTAFYWLWKNRLTDRNDSTEYYGFFHYRRMLDISDADIKRMKANCVDVVLQFPTLHEPDINEHHKRYIRDMDWEAMLKALAELQPEYAEAYTDLFSEPYFYNYNMLIAKREILADYCQWLFPILERTEELSNPKGLERADRYLAYMSESLLTLYFLYNRDGLRIYHTGRVMLV